ncbi:sulfite exporter TauE/SafE family protein [Candidatus Microgenomates bacterium]|nr:sulfite exporter TauE/SafE family protein [Candidatus Microgenomates bacterium]
MFEISFPIAFVAGIVSFFAPCVVPLLPTYVAYVSGVSLGQLRGGITAYQSKLLVSSLFYIIGFSLIFVLFGTAAGSIGSLLRQYQLWIQIIGGLFVIVFGLEFAGFLHIPLLARGGSVSLPAWTAKLGYARSLLIGILFAIVWTPCIGVVLGSILTIAAVQATALQGALLLFVYSLGISIPFLIVAATLAQAPKYLQTIARHTGLISRVAGLLLVAIGLLLVTDTYKYVNGWIFEIAFKWGYQIR